MSTSDRVGRQRDPCGVGAEWLVRGERVRARDGQVSVRSDPILRTYDSSLLYLPRVCRESWFATLVASLNSSKVCIKSIGRNAKYWFIKIPRVYPLFRFFLVFSLALCRHLL